ncbi:MAG: patatin-like protein [Acidimicrobiales bacterium]|nr:patatin-like protein [Acidimicrobiales bacterium]
MGRLGEVADDAAGSDDRLPAVRELRIAPVMTGGTSLAVWMGGATAELYAMYRSAPVPPGPTTPLGDRPTVSAIYRRLLDLTRTTPVIDVITGTSAGGLNGTLLATAVFNDISTETFAGSRDVWMQTADIGNLTRSTDEANPPSLLRGDDYFTVQVRDVLQRWWRRPGADARESRNRVDLLTTFTSLTPLPVARIDDFDEALNETTHAGTLRFEPDHFRATEEPEAGSKERSATMCLKLAVASRTSASIPGVFEPSFLAGTDDDADASHPNLDEHLPVSWRGASRWAVDGGVVVNLPLRYVPDRVFEQPARDQVRRVIAYVSPTPSSDRALTSDVADTMPSIISSVMSIGTAPRAEGISRDVDTIRRHNETVRHQQAARRSLSALVGPGTTLEPSLLRRFKERRAELSVNLVLDRLRPQQPKGVDEERLRSALLRARVALTPDDPNLDDPNLRWRWGVAPVEEAASTALGLISRGVDLLNIPLPDKPAIEMGQMDVARVRVHAQMKRLSSIRDQDEVHWRQALDGWSADDDAALQTRCVAAYEKWPNLSDATAREAAFATLADAHLEIVRALISAAALIGPMCATVIARLEGAGGGEALRYLNLAGDLWDELNALMPSLVDDRPEVTTEEVATAAWLKVCGSAGAIELSKNTASDATVLWDQATTTSNPGTSGGSGEQGAASSEPAPNSQAPNTLEREVRTRLLVAHVAATALFVEVTTREQPAEIIQVSWNADNQLDPTRTPDEKLAGTELARLGAFLKPSWRANDWFWGRMDGAARIARLLVDPRRLWECRVSSADLRIAFGLSDPLTGDGRAGPIAEELAFLDEPVERASVPTNLPKLTAHVTEMLQLAIAREELPRVAEAINRSADEGGNERASRPFLRAVDGTDFGTADAEAIKGLVRELRIGDETTATEAGSNLMVRTVTRLASVATNALSGNRAGAAPLSGVLKGVRLPLQALSAMVGVLTRSSPLARGLTSAILATCGAVLALRLSGFDVSGLVVAFAGVLFVGSFVLALWRMGSRRRAIVLGAAGVVVALALLGRGADALLFTNRDEDLWWKRWFFLNKRWGVNLAAVLAGIVAMIAAARHVLRSRQIGPAFDLQRKRYPSIPDSDWDVQEALERKRGVRQLAGALGGLVILAAGALFLAEPLLTGRRDDDSILGRVKDAVADAADWLAHPPFWLLLVVLAGIGALLGVGRDLAQKWWKYEAPPPPSRSRT